MKNIYLFFLSITLICCNKSNEVEFEPSVEDVQLNLSAFGSKARNIDTIYVNETEEVIISNPYKHKGRLALKGSMHNHTDISAPIDGYASGNPAEIAKIFRDVSKYDFYTFTDHNAIGVNPKVEGIIWMGCSVEDTKFGEAMQHLCVYNLPYTVRDINWSDDINTLIQYYKNIGAFVSYAHPDWAPQYQASSKIQQVVKPDFVEVLNSAKGGSERAFNILASKYNGEVFGFGTDDFHYDGLWDDPWKYFNKSYIMVYADKKNKQSIWEAILRGCFYASKGAQMDISCVGGIVNVATQIDSKITIFGKNTQNVESPIVLIYNPSGTKLEYSITGKEGYLYAKIENKEGVAISQVIAIK